jgi:hypothetical protein
VSYCGTSACSGTFLLDGCRITRDDTGFGSDVLSTLGVDGSDTWVGTFVIGRLLKA